MAAYNAHLALVVMMSAISLRGALINGCTNLSTARRILRITSAVKSLPSSDDEPHVLATCPYRSLGCEPPDYVALSDSSIRQHLSYL